MTREELFNQAKANRAKQKEEEANRKSSSGGWSGEYEQIAYVALIPNKDKVVRLLGNPLTVRETPSDPKEFLLSQIWYVENVKSLDEFSSNAKRKKFNCIWKPKNEDEKDWILWRIQQEVMTYTWNKDTRERDYSLKGGPLTPLFNEIAYNGRPDNKYETGWYPRTLIAMNVIDRMDMPWHQENKHTKILSCKMNTFENDKNETIVYYDRGVPRKLYNAIWDGIVEYNGDWEGYDVVLRKKEDDPWYEAFHGIDDQKKIQADVKPYIVDRALTDEEKTWERYDLDALCPVTSYLKIFNRLGGYVKLIDKFLDTKFYDELQTYAEEDKKKFEQLAKEKKEAEGTSASKTPAAKNDSEEDQPAESPAISTEPVATKAVEEPVPVRPSRTPASETKGINWEALGAGTWNPEDCLDWSSLSDTEKASSKTFFKDRKYLGVPKLTPEERETILGVLHNGAFKYVEVYKGERLKLYECKDNKFQSPGTFHCDPLSGIDF